MLSMAGMTTADVTRPRYIEQVFRDAHGKLRVEVAERMLRNAHALALAGNICDGRTDCSLAEITRRAGQLALGTDAKLLSTASAPPVGLMSSQLGETLNPLTGTVERGFASTNSQLGKVHDAVMASKAASEHCIKLRQEAVAERKRLLAILTDESNFCDKNTLIKQAIAVGRKEAKVQVLMDVRAACLSPEMPLELEILPEEIGPIAACEVLPDEALKRLALALGGLHGYNVSVVGHADSRDAAGCPGRAKDGKHNNIELSKRRADQVLDYLKGHLANSNSFTNATGKGARDPASQCLNNGNETEMEECYRSNRRVQVFLSKPNGRLAESGCFGGP